MPNTNETAHHGWQMSLLAIALALTIAMGVGFLVGQQTPAAPDDMSAICRVLSQEALTKDCIALRSAVAAERENLISQWALWVTVGSVVAGAAALVGLINAFIQGSHSIRLATVANRIAINNSQMQSRAYVVVLSVECKLSEQGELLTKVKFQNSGLTPARQLRWLYNANLSIIDNDNEQNNLMLGDEPDLETSHWRQDIPSAKDWTSTPLSLRHSEGPEVRTLINQAVFIAVTVKIVADYQDVFGNTHPVITCFQGKVDTALSDATYTELERAHDAVFDEHAKRMTA